ncbi:F0F1 ATP synthase subunit epsilon [Mycoplasmopsis bovirhinis]|uniref:ATP synthase epsilon chain n=1 Tax=Mycoplasmopsis bovirhinis TaxID=29553 RepID=A0A449ACN8_9BACT|nr:ATP synthase F1 subunit epsilon [Mycoplasmopsis bovirhinis]VEU62811.1 ATP synthase epsilon subunit [Mycoplasmopsis bovirhinis]
MAKTYLKITIPSGIFYEGYTEIVTLKTSVGYIGLQANKSPLFSNIELGTLTIGWEHDESSEKYYIGGGLVYANGSKIDIITDDIIKLSEIDLKKQLAEKEALERAIAEGNPDTFDIAKLETKLKRTLFKIKNFTNG